MEAPQHNSLKSGKEYQRICAYHQMQAQLLRIVQVFPLIDQKLYPSCCSYAKSTGLSGLKADVEFLLIAPIDVVLQEYEASQVSIPEIVACQHQNPVASFLEINDLKRLREELQAFVDAPVLNQWPALSENARQRLKETADILERSVGVHVEEVPSDSACCI